MFISIASRGLISSFHHKTCFRNPFLLRVLNKFLRGKKRIFLRLFFDFIKCSPYHNSFDPGVKRRYTFERSEIGENFNKSILQCVLRTILIFTIAKADGIHLPAKAFIKQLLTISVLLQTFFYKYFVQLTGIDLHF